MVYHILYKHLALIESAGLYILRKHRVGDIHTDDSLYTITLLMRNLRTHLRARQHDNKHGQSRIHQPKLYRRSKARDIRHHILQQRRVAELTQFPPTLSPRNETYDGKQWNEPQQQEIYRIFES